MKKITHLTFDSDIPMREAENILGLLGDVTSHDSSYLGLYSLLKLENGTSIKLIDSATYDIDEEEDSCKPKPEQEKHINYRMEIDSLDDVQNLSFIDILLKNLHAKNVRTI